MRRLADTRGTMRAMLATSMPQYSYCPVAGMKKKNLHWLSGSHSMRYDATPNTAPDAPRDGMTLPMIARFMGAAMSEAPIPAPVYRVMNSIGLIWYHLWARAGSANGQNPGRDFVYLFRALPCGANGSRRGMVCRGDPTTSHPRTELRAIMLKAKCPRPLCE